MQFVSQKTLPLPLKDWSIQVIYTARDDNGRQFQARCSFHCRATDIPSAYAQAERADWKGYEPIKLGVILPGRHYLKV